MTSEDIEYVINMVLSALDLTSLSEEDTEDILNVATAFVVDKSMRALAKKNYFCIIKDTCCVV